MSSTPSPPPPPPRPIESVLACFDGLLLSVLAFGALLMLFVQLAQVLLHRPSRDQTFWGIISYSSILFAFVMAAIVGKFKHAEVLYVLHDDYPGGGRAYYSTHAVPWCQILLQISAIVIPSFADMLMFYRLMVLYTRQWIILILPAALYLARIGISVPVILSASKPVNARDAGYDYNYNVALASVSVALNITFSAFVFFRLFTMRHKAERILGRLHATLYTSHSTLFVESGALFTIWAIVYLIVRSTGHWIQDAFLQPYTYIIVLTRMLIVLRIAQNRAWTGDIINAADDGMLDWSISSSISIELSQHNHEDRTRHSASACSVSFPAS